MAALAAAVHVTFSIGERGYVTVQLQVGVAEHGKASQPVNSKAEHRGLKPGAAQGKKRCSSYFLTCLWHSLPPS